MKNKNEKLKEVLDEIVPKETSMDTDISTLFSTILEKVWELPVEVTVEEGLDTKYNLHISISNNSYNILVKRNYNKEDLIGILSTLIEEFLQDKHKQDILDIFKEYLLNEGKSSKTIKSYVGDISSFLTWLQSKGVGYFETISRFHINSYKEYLKEKNYTYNTYNKKHSYLLISN